VPRAVEVKPRPGERDQPLVALVHLPKTAGTTLTALMRYHYRRGRFLTTGNVFSRFEQVEAKLREIGGLTHIGAVAGHFTFGLSDRLPADTRYITILRDPVERTLSHFGFLVLPRAGRTRAAGPAIVPSWLPPPGPDLTLADCLADGGYIPDNLQTRMLCGLASPYDALPPDALETAKRNLRERFAFVGTTERFIESLALLNVQMGWPAVAQGRRRVHLIRPRKEDVAASDLRLIEERNGLDRELHTQATELLAEALDRASPEVDVEIEVLRRVEQRRPGAGTSRPVTIDGSWPVEARVALAFKEKELASAELEIKRLRKQLKQEARRT
jgi:hypothetical protein